jgi:hypothetical protein
MIVVSDWNIHARGVLNIGSLTKQLEIVIVNTGDETKRITVRETPQTIVIRCYKK